MSSFREYAHAIVWTKRHLFGQLKVLEIATVRQFVDPGDTVLDVGAHGGSWSVPLSRVLRSGRVIAFEALPYYARVLRMTLALLGIRNVTVVNHPVLDEHKTIEMVRRSASGKRLTGMTHVRGNNEEALETITMESVVLDKFVSNLQGKIAFIKMDIEGAELLALKGAKHLLAQHRPTLFMEVNEVYCARYGYTTEDVFSFMNEQGFDGCTFSAGGWKPLASKDYSGAGDVWFLPRERVEKTLCIH